MYILTNKFFIRTSFLKLSRKAVIDVFYNNPTEATDQQAIDYLLVQLVSIMTVQSNMMKCIPDSLSTIADMVDLYHDDPVRFYACTEGMTKEERGDLVALSMVAKKHASTKDVYTEPPWSTKEENDLENIVKKAVQNEIEFRYGIKRLRTEQSE